MACLNFAPQTLTFASHMLHHFRNLPLALSLSFKVFKVHSLWFLLFLSAFFHIYLYVSFSSQFCVNLSSVIIKLLREAENIGTAEGYTGSIISTSLLISSANY